MCCKRDTVIKVNNCINHKPIISYIIDQGQSITTVVVKKKQNSSISYLTYKPKVCESEGH